MDYNMRKNNNNNAFISCLVMKISDPTDCLDNEWCRFTSHLHLSPLREADPVKEAGILFFFSAALSSGGAARSAI